LRQEEKKLAAKTKRMGEQWSEKLTAVNTNVKALKLEGREKDEEYFESW
jgi:collagenase-like PrtC family protease